LPGKGLPLMVGTAGAAGIHGARFLVRSNEHLCVLDNYGASVPPATTIEPAEPGAFGLTGYRPYE
jgi:hypothetical protein